MSVNVKLYKTESNPLKLDRDVGDNVFDKNGSFIEPLDILHPVFKISGESSILDANLVYIKNFGERYYFIDKIIPVTSEIYEIHCSDVDVLKTYPSEIKSSLVITDKQSKKFNNLYNDGTFRTSEDVAELFINFPNNLVPVDGNGNPSTIWLLTCV